MDDKIFNIYPYYQTKTYKAVQPKDPLMWYTYDSKRPCAVKHNDPICDHVFDDFLTYKNIVELFLNYPLKTTVITYFKVLIHIDKIANWYETIIGRFIIDLQRNPYTLQNEEPISNEDLTKPNSFYTIIESDYKLQKFFNFRECYTDLNNNIFMHCIFDPCENKALFLCNEQTYIQHLNISEFETSAPNQPFFFHIYLDCVKYSQINFGVQVYSIQEEIFPSLFQLVHHTAFRNQAATLLERCTKIYFPLFKMADIKTLFAFCMLNTSMYMFSYIYIKAGPLESWPSQSNFCHPSYKLLLILLQILISRAGKLKKTLWERL